MLTNPGQKTVQPALEAHTHFISVESFSSDIIYLFVCLLNFLKFDLAERKRDLAERKATFPSGVILSQPVKIDMSS